MGQRTQHRAKCIKLRRKHRGKPHGIEYDTKSIGNKRKKIDKLDPIKIKNFKVFVYFFILINLFILFIYFWLRWVFVAARGLSLVGVSGGYSSLWCVGFSLQWLLLLWSTGSRCVGFSSCGSHAQ